VKIFIIISKEMEIDHQGRTFLKMTAVEINNVRGE
jgi:hypothetical protein